MTKNTNTTIPADADGGLLRGLVAEGRLTARSWGPHPTDKTLLGPVVHAYADPARSRDCICGDVIVVASGGDAVCSGGENGRPTRGGPVDRPPYRTLQIDRART